MIFDHNNKASSQDNSSRSSKDVTEQSKLKLTHQGAVACRGRSLISKSALLVITVNVYSVFCRNTSNVLSVLVGGEEKCFKITLKSL